ncbi:hypothetical protein L596_023478 [Steinernema carpocapsae]|uniref:CID domain-containing protein n=1 Tax=Steinernema carpocapsae TaxID=34508 RepID=A0A4U5MDZ8_STECR|nr:hypothetical protein L596_023478 [Steinernema carpocapsae]
MANDVVRDYKRTLLELNRNDKTKINLLTMLAEDYVNYAAQIVSVIEARLTDVPNPALKLTILYVADSILKNVQGTSAYKDQFAKIIVKMFVHIFQRSDEKQRAQLFRLRNTWKDLFPRSKLYELDIKTREVDSNWPVDNSQLSGSSSSNNSKPSAPQQPKPSSALTDIPGVHVNPKFIGSRPTTSQESRSPVQNQPKPAVVKAHGSDPRLRGRNGAPAPETKKRKMPPVQPTVPPFSKRQAPSPPMMQQPPQMPLQHTTTPFPPVRLRCFLLRRCHLDPSRSLR